jgi:hypothetical protein
MRLRRMTFRPTVGVTSDPQMPIRVMLGGMVAEMTPEEAGRIARALREAVAEVNDKYRGDN